MEMRRECALVAYKEVRLFPLCLALRLTYTAKNGCLADCAPRGLSASKVLQSTMLETRLLHSGIFRRLKHRACATLDGELLGTINSQPISGEAFENV